jgi:hypothetical protein
MLSRFAEGVPEKARATARLLQGWRALLPTLANCGERGAPGKSKSNSNCRNNTVAELDDTAIPH